MNRKAPWCQTWHSRLNIMLLVTVTGWLAGLAGEGPSASLPQIQTLHTVGICSGTVDSTASLHPQWRARQDSPSHTNNNMHAVFTDNALLFIFQSTHTGHFFFSLHFWDRCFKRGMTSLSVPGSEIWIHLTMQFKDPFWERGAGRSTRYMSKMPEQLQFDVACFNHSPICLLYLFIYLPLNLFFYLKGEKKLSCNFLASLQILYILRDCFYFLVALFFKWIIHKPYGSFVMLQDFKTAQFVETHLLCIEFCHYLSVFCDFLLLSLRLKLKSLNDVLCECVFSSISSVDIIY